METLVTANAERMLYWDASFDERMPQISGQAVTYAPSGDMLATPDRKGIVRLFDFSSRELLKSIILPKEDSSPRSGQQALHFTERGLGR